MAEVAPSIDATLVDKETTWKSLGLDGRLLRALDNLRWTNPSLVQAKAIPMALKGMLLSPTILTNKNRRGSN